MTISEVSKRYDISVETLRYYERIGILRDVQRTLSGLRNYSEENCKSVEFLKCMRDAGVSIEILQEYIELLYQGDDTLEQRRNLLIEQRKILQRKHEELQATIERLNYKIEHYNSLCDGRCK